MPEYSLWLLAIIIIFLIIWLAMSLRRISQLKKLVTETKEAQYGEVIRTIDHHRHDWMNIVQVLFGYIQLNKRDKLIAYIEKVSDQMRFEGLISKLGIPYLIAYFISFRANTNTLILDVKLEQEVSLDKFGEQGIRVAQAIISIVEAYKSVAGHGEGDANQLSITMNEWDGQLFIGFEYDGISDIERLRNNLQPIIERISKRQDIHVTIEETEHAVDIEVRVRSSETTG